MNKEALAQLFYRELSKIEENDLLSVADKVAACRHLLQAIFQEMTRVEKLHFSTFFARISYVGHKFQISKSLLFHLHHFRHLALKVAHTGQASEDVWLLGRKVVCLLIAHLMDQPAPEHLQDCLHAPWPLDPGQVSIKAFLPHLRVVVVEDRPAEQQFLARTEQRPDTDILLQYGIPERNESFQPTIELIRKVIGFPACLNLLEVEIDDNNVYRPRAIVVEPDYLIDVSAVAATYSGREIDVWGYLLKKYLPFRISVPIMVGNIANYFLDELMSDATVDFQVLKTQLFSLNPLAFSCFGNAEVRKMIDQSQKHFVNLRQVVTHSLAEIDIENKDCYLEPSFYSENYGLQGRLDLLHRPRGEGRTAIVELKSGKPFMANIYGISPAHFTQTLLYDLLIRSAFGAESDPANYMLYSGEEDRHLRFAPATRSQQYEAVQIRNQLLAIEYLLAQLGQGEGTLSVQADRLFSRLKPEKFPGLKGFARDNLESFRKTYQALRPIERAYFAAYSGFIAREHRIAKTGIQGREKANGLATLWLDSEADKDVQFSLLRGLCPVDNQAAAAEPTITFLRTERSNPLANFRQGDIAVLYPYLSGDAGVLRNQIFRCTILQIDAEKVKVRLRARQFNDRLFREITEWSLEPDLLDSSFNIYYRALYTFAGATLDRRALLLTEQAPARSEPSVIAPVPGMTEEQYDILAQMLAAPDYFLLWGPPGTGKTSLMLHHVVAHLLTAGQESMLLLAYTNRAVDEICESIERIHPGVRQQYIRIGSASGTGERFQERLLQHLSSGLSKRAELQNIITEARIVVGTVSSIMGKPELFQIKQFDRVIIDEASQILEPILVGLLTRVRRFILIGDHRQLPAVVQQTEEETRIEDADLARIGLQDLSGSFFERLYRRCQQEDWHWAFAQLSRQGRMHRQVMAFPSQQFYAGKLHTLPEGIPGHQKQIEALDFQLPENIDDKIKKLAFRRLLFFPTPIDRRSVTGKTNRPEAERVGDLVEHFRWLYAHNDMPWHAQTLGIITPYRAQIAQIRQVLFERELDPTAYSIDTVERYQGGARDIIIISLCTNYQQQVAQLSSFSSDGVDRKLNVAMTRARERLLILGNPALLKSNPVYAELLQYCYSEDAWVVD